MIMDTDETMEDMVGRIRMLLSKLKKIKKENPEKVVYLVNFQDAIS